MAKPIVATSTLKGDDAKRLLRIASLDDAAAEPGMDEAWALEIRKRLLELDEGAVRCIPASEFLAGLHKAARGSSS